MRVLAIDIGGTSSRFADAQIENLDSVHLGEPLILPTGDASLQSFDDLLARFQERVSDAPADFSAYDAVAVGAAGAVLDRRALLTNVRWNIDLDESRFGSRFLLLNDFVAQGYAFAIRQCVAELQVVRDSAHGYGTAAAIVGSGTGLGHCLLRPLPARNPTALAGGTDFFVIASEYGHANFPFVGRQEQAFEAFLTKRLGDRPLTYDDIVSGSGLSAIHAFLTGEELDPGAIAGDRIANQASIDWFSRFYARACKNYCLATGTFSRLIVSGGIAAKNPHMVASEAFLEELQNSRNYAKVMAGMSVLLNTDETVGLKGAAAFAMISGAQFY